MVRFSSQVLGPGAARRRAPPEWNSPPVTRSRFMLASLIMIAIIAFARVLLLSTKKVSTDRFVRMLSDRSVDEVRGRLKADLSTMSAAEVRGYIRGRALGVLRRQARLVAGDAGQTELPEEVILGALERTVHLVVRQWMTTLAPSVAVRVG
jgi:hypothetical protein